MTRQVVPRGRGAGKKVGSIAFEDDGLITLDPDDREAEWRTDPAYARELNGR
jgi:hypothetical protein